MSTNVCVFLFIVPYEKRTNVLKLLIVSCQTSGYEEMKTEHSVILKLMSYYFCLIKLGMYIRCGRITRPSSGL